MQKRLALLATLSFVACGNNKVPLPTGLKVKATTTTARTRTGYIKHGAAAPVPSSASFTTAANCTTVLEPQATRTSTESTTGTTTLEVLGQSNASHPLVPNADTFAPQQVSIVKGLFSESGESVVTTTTFTPGAGADERITQTTTEATNTVGNASYFGIAVDEYYVVLNSLANLWTELDQHADHNPEPKSNENAQEFGANLLTRYEPKKGDIWSSTDGRILYFADGTEELTISGKKYTTNRVKAYTVAGLDPTAADVLATCVSELKVDTTTTQTGGMNTSNPRAFLNEACNSTGMENGINSFVHSLDGTEWWYKGILVKANYVRNRVSIAPNPQPGDPLGTPSYGYEYTTADTPVPGQCTRNVSTNRPGGSIVSNLFIQYTVATETVDVLATELTEAAQ